MAEQIPAPRATVDVSAGVPELPAGPVEAVPGLLPSPRRRRPAASVVALAACTVALGTALLVPRIYSDPVAVDPYATRLAVVSLGLLLVSLAPALRAARPTLLGVAAVAAPFCAWAATPKAADLLSRGGVVGNAAVLAADAVYAALSLGAVVWARWWLPPEARPRSRLASFSSAAAGAALLGSILLLGVGLALPAPLLGREAIEPQALARDLPLLGPAFALQGFAQEVQFRGLLLGALELDLPSWGANLAQAVFFGLAHVAVQYEGPAGPFVPVTIVLGWILGWLTQRTGSVWPAVVIHAVAEIAVAVAILPGLYGL